MTFTWKREKKRKKIFSPHSLPHSLTPLFASFPCSSLVAIGSELSWLKLPSHPVRDAWASVSDFEDQHRRIASNQLQGNTMSISQRLMPINATQLMRWLACLSSITNHRLEGRVHKPEGQKDGAAASSCPRRVLENIFSD